MLTGTTAFSDSTHLTQSVRSRTSCDDLIRHQSHDVGLKCWMFSVRKKFTPTVFNKPAFTEVIQVNLHASYLPSTWVFFSTPPGKTTIRESSLSIRFSFWSMVKRGLPGCHWEKPEQSAVFSPGGDGALVLVDTLQLDKKMASLRFAAAFVCTFKHCISLCKQIKEFLIVALHKKNKNKL